MTDKELAMQLDQCYAHLNPMSVIHINGITIKRIERVNDEDIIKARQCLELVLAEALRRNWFEYENI